MLIYQSPGASAPRPSNPLLRIVFAIGNAVKHDLRIVTAEERLRALETSAIESLRSFCEGDSAVTTLWLVTQLLKARVWGSREISIAVAVHTEASFQEFTVTWHDGGRDRFVARVVGGDLAVTKVVPC